MNFLTSFKVKSLLYHNVEFVTKLNIKDIGYVNYLSNGKIGILTKRESFPLSDIKSVKDMD